MKFKTVVFVFVVVVVIFLSSYDKNSKSSFREKQFNSKIMHYTNVFPSFDTNDFKQVCGNEMVEVGDFKVNESSHLYPVSTVKVKLAEWFTDKFKNQNKQSRLSFFNESTSIISKYMFDWIKQNKQYFPQKLTDRLNSKCNYTLRISRGQWEYPSHFDGVDNFMIILSGNRNVILDHKIQKTLKPNDILYFESCIEHHFWCEPDNNLNIVLNLIYEPSSVCAIDFSDAYKKQMTRIKTGKDII